MVKHNDKEEKQEDPLCQCPLNDNENPCPKKAINGTTFCEDHQNCKPSPTNNYEPDYIPDILNNMEAYLQTNNCLSYAIHGNRLNKELIAKCKDPKNCDVNFEQPGAASGERKAMSKKILRTCPVVEKLTKSDLGSAFKSSTFYGVCPKGMSKVALVVDNGVDYHWYRQNPDGYWSHKDGSNPVKDFDAKKQKIFNPKQASRDYGKDLNYDNFCGFFCVDRTKKLKLKQGGMRKKLKAKATNTKGANNNTMRNNTKRNNNTKKNNTKANNTKRNNTKRNNTKRNNTKANNTKANNTKANNTKPNNTKPNNANSANNLLI
jgi:hypothetical protein